MVSEDYLCVTPLTKHHKGSAPFPTLTVPKASSDARRRVRCFVEGGVGLVTVEVSSEEEVGDVKRFVREECMNGLLRNVDARDLALWKVTTS